MQSTPQPQKNFCGLSRENLALLMHAQELLLAERQRRGLPLDGRVIENLDRLKAAMRSV
jgi:hypothetical protein